MKFNSASIRQSITMCNDIAQIFLGSLVIQGVVEKRNLVTIVLGLLLCTILWIGAYALSNIQERITL